MRSTVAAAVALALVACNGDDTPAPSATDAGAGEASACATTEKPCGGRCVALDDPAYGCAAGSCAPCPTAGGSASCRSGACALSCASGYAECAGACADLGSDPQNCGACGRSCLGATCAGGLCKP